MSIISIKKEMKESYKFIHLMPSGASIFSIEYVKFIVEEFDCSDHLFVLYKSKKMEELLGFSNIRHEQHFSLASLLQYASQGKYILLHSLALSPLELMQMKDEIARKIIWCVWGNDLYHRKPVDTFSPIFFKRIIQHIKRPISLFLYSFNKRLWKIADKKIKSFQTIVAMFEADMDEIRRRFGEKMKISSALYTIGYYIEDVEKISLLVNKQETWILIGHSGYPFLKHKKYLDLLYQYKDENFKIILPLSYGGTQYIKEIANYANQLYKDKVLVLQDYMTWLDYAQYLTSIDVAILDYEHQSALGNISLLLWGRSKLYLSRTGVIYKGLNKFGVNTYDCNQIGEETFDAFCRKERSTEEGFLYARTTFDKKVIKKKWEELFSSLQ